jgi:tetratricopeptide (TPR) repeat protein
VLARQRVAEAQGRLGTERASLPGLAADIDRTRDEIEGRQRDEDRFQQFLKLASRAQGAMSYSNQLGGDRMAREALDLYGVLVENEWLSRLETLYLTAAEKQQIREMAYVTLVSLADYEVRWNTPDHPRSAPRSLDLLRRAQTFHEPTRAFYFVRSESHRVQGNTAAAEEDKKQFKVAVARTAWDYFLPGHTASWNGDLEEGIRSYRKALRVQPNHYNSLYFLACRLASDKINRYPEAVQLFTACLALQPNNTNAYHHRAQCHQKLGQLEDAEADYSAAITAADTEWDEQPPLIDAYKLRRKFYEEMGCSEKARQDQAQLIELAEQWREKQNAKLGPDHPDTLLSMNNLACAYLDAGRLAEAIALHEQTLKRAKAKLGPDHPHTLISENNLAIAYHEVGKLDQADRLWRDLLERQRKNSGPKSADTAAALAWLGDNLLKQQRYAEAESLLRECLAIREQKLPDDWRCFNARSLLGGALLGRQQYAAADQLLLQGYEGMKQREAQIDPQNKRRLVEAIERLVQFYEATEQPEKASAWRKKLPPANAPPRKP